MSYDPSRILDHLANRLPQGAETILALPEVPNGIDPGVHRFLTAVKTALASDAVSWTALVNRGFARSINGVVVPATDDVGSGGGGGFEPDLTVPPAPANVDASGAMTNIIVTWDDPGYSIHAYAEIWAAAVDNLSLAVVVGQTPGNIFPHYVGTNTARYYWVRFVSVADVKGPFNGVSGTLGTTGFVGTADITDAAITIQKIHDKRIAITGDTWTDDTPDTDSVSWSAMTIVYNGTAYSITGSNTSNKWIYWTAGNTTLSSSASFPSLADNEFLVAINNSGVHDLVWNGNGIARSIIGDTALIGDLVVGTANIQNAAITNAKVNDLAADKITAGDIAAARMQTNVLTALQVTATSLSTITADVGQLVIATTGYIRSGKTAYGSGTGFFMEANSGTPRFDIGNSTDYLRWDGSTVLVGGDIIASGNIQAAAITATHIADATITGAKIANATITGSNIAGTTITASNIVNATITATQIADSTITGAKIAGSTITGSNIDNSTITGAKIAGSTITGSNIASSTITATHIQAGTITVDRLQTSSASFNSVTVALGGSAGIGSNTSGISAITSNSSRFGILCSNTGGGISGGFGSINSTGVALIAVGGGTDSAYASYGKSAALGGWDWAGYFQAGTSGPLPTNPPGKWVKLATASFAVEYAGGTSGTFTGGHDGLYPLANPTPEPGDILVDTGMVAASSIYDTVGYVALSTIANQIGTIGVYTEDAVNHIPPPLLDYVDGEHVLAAAYEYLFVTHKSVVINALGEGLINVVGEGGNIAIGDLIVTSSTAGKGMKQSDGIIRNTTVAKAREAVTFADPADEHQIACIYLAG